jgi:nitrate/nitrite transport system permease protein
MDPEALVLKASGQRQPLLLSLGLLGLFVLIWHLATIRPSFDPKGLTSDQLQKMEFNGDIVRTRDGRYVYNPEKVQGMPGPWAVVTKAVEEFAQAFHKKGTNDHGIGHLIRYTVWSGTTCISPGSCLLF